MTPKPPTGLDPAPHVRPHLPQEPAAPPRPRKRRGWLWFVLAIGLAAGLYYYWQRNSSASAGTVPSSESKGGKKGERGMGGPPPVVAVHAKRGSIGVYVTGLGNVTPLYTVAVKSRVDGQLMQVYFKEGDIVKKDQPLLEIDPRPFQVALEQAEGQLARDEALLENAKVDQKRYQTLLAQNAIPEQQVATQNALVNQYVGVVKSDQGMIDSAKLNLVYCHITAPISGRIGLRLVDPGNIVHASDTNAMLVITQLQPISVIFPISEKDLEAVRTRFDAGQALKVEAWSVGDTNRIATGTLATIDNQIDQTTGTVKLRANFENKDNALFPNQFINAHLLVQEKGGVVLLPTAAIQRTSSHSYVWLLNPDDTVTARDITEGVEEGETSEVLSGIQAGDAVVMTGVDKLTDGGKVIPSFQDGSNAAGRGRPTAAPANSTRPSAVTKGAGRKTN